MKITEEMIEQRNRWLRVVSELTGVSTDDILGKSRLERIVSARMFVMWSLRTFCDYSFPIIGRLMRRHYSTAIYAVGKVNGRCHLTRREMDVKNALLDIQRKAAQG